MVEGVTIYVFVYLHIEATLEVRGCRCRYVLSKNAVKFQEAGL